jgi:hypothetical protein
VIPIDTNLVGVRVYGDVAVDGDTVLVFRQTPPVTALAARTGAPDAPEQPPLIEMVAA